MFCSFCKKSASKLVTHSLGDCCLLHLKCCEASAASRLVVDKDEDAIRTVECDICLEEYQEDELQRHREMCMPRLVFRCSLCDEDYLSKEGLWNHLSLHEIANESKELYYQERSVTYKQHKCILCNDQRCFQESVYWRHVHEDHDGFFLRCSECGESFRSQQRMTDHALNHCTSREQAIPFESGGLDMDDGNATGDKQQNSLESEIVESLSVDFYEHCSELVTECDDNRTGCYDQINDEIEKTSDVQPVSQLKNKKNNPIPNVASGGICSSESSDIKCSQCSKKYFSAKILSRHFQRCHRPTTCDVCGVVFSTFNQFRYHKLISHSGVLYKCHECPMEFNVKHSYQRHVARHHKAMKLCCKICNRKLKTSVALAKHMSLCHSDFTKIQQQYQAKTVVKTDCPICRKSFSDQEQVSQHVQKIHKLTICKICGETYGSTDEQNNHKCKICPHCGKQCYNPTRLIVHITKTHELTACDICGMSFAGKSKMMYHKLTAHSEPKYKCLHCSKKCYLKYDYLRHLSFCLKGKVLRCKICQRTFGKLVHLTDHMEMAHGEKRIQTDLGDCIEPKSCDVLNVRQEEEMEMESIVEVEETMLLKAENKIPHDPDCNSPVENVANTRIQNKGQNRRLHISQTLDGYPLSGFSDTKCPDCGKECYHTERLTIHFTRRHKVTECKICHASIVGRDQTWYHKLKVHSEPKYKCSHCSKKFYLKHGYRRHMSVHKIIKGYPCKFCGRKFKTLHDVGRHVKHVHFVSKVQPDREHVQQMAIKEEISELDDDGDKLMSLPSTSGSTIKCPHCDKKFQQDKFLIRHIASNHKPRTCNICGLNFEKTHQLYYHKLTCHSEPRHKCPHCPEKFHLKSLCDRHVSRHKENTFPCKLCSLKFKTALSVSKHVKLSHRAKEMKTEATKM